MAYVYRHIRLDKNEPFYIGIGSDKNYYRSTEVFRRNKHWKNIVNKTEYRVEIILDDLTWEEACEKEKEFIALYGRKNTGCGFLVNMTDGGEGTLGRVVSERERLLISIRSKGERNYNYGKKLSDERKAFLSAINSGENHPNFGKKLKHSTILKISKKVIDTSNGIIYNSVREAADSFNMKYKTLANMLNGSSKRNKTTLKYL